jgi:hypothetical protein
MNKALTILGGLGAGAALMYLFDPDRGNRRRALIRDKAVSLNRRTQRAVTGKVEDLRNRTKGMLHEAKSAFEHGREQSSGQPQQPDTF